MTRSTIRAAQPGRALLGLAALALAALAAMPAQAEVKINFSSAAPPADFLSKSMIVFKEKLEASAPGQFDVQNHFASSLFKQGTEVPAMQRGTLEMSTMTTFEVAQQMPQYGFFNRAYLFRDYDHMLKTMRGPIGQDYAKAVAAKMGIEILDIAYLGTRTVSLRKKREVKTPADMAGLKFRMPSGPDWLVLGRVLGVQATPMAMPDVYLALKTGTIDGQENPLTIFRAAKFNEVEEQVVLTQHMIQPVFYAMAKPVWDKLSAEQKQKVKAAARAATDDNNVKRHADEQQVVDAIKGQGLTVSAIDLAPFRTNADKVYGALPEAKAWDKAMLAKVMAEQ
jgi:tripartite ATP-independent transporter DctP family solute receptor